MALLAHGGPEQLAWCDLPVPEPGPFDLRLAVRATSVNPIDTRIRRASAFPRAFPLVLGYDAAGLVDAAGSAVEGFAPGDRVFASPSAVRPGANAEFVLVDARTAAHLPDTVDFLTAAATPLAAMTAWECLFDRTRVTAGQTILIQGGAGGVGHFAIQLAREAGCHVLATAGRPESLQLCRSLGAEPLDYRAAPIADQVRQATAGRGCDAVLDFVGGPVFEQSLDCVAVDGHLVTIVPTESNQLAAKLFLRNVTLHYEFMGAGVAFGTRPESQGRMLTELARRLADGRLVPRIDRVFPLGDLAEAHRAIETQRTLGKIVVHVAG